MPPTKQAAETFTDDELEGLSDEERAALDYDEPGEGSETASTEDDETSGVADEEGKAGDASGDEAAAKDDEAGADKASEPDASEPKTPAAEDKAEPAAEADDAEPAVDATEQRDDIAKIQTDYQDNMASLQEEIDGLGKKVEDGEMTFAEYHKRNQELQDAKIQARVTFEDDMNWQRAQSTFFQNEDNKLFLDPMRQTFLQATIDQMYKAGEMNGLDYGSAIAKAAERVRGALNIGAETASPPPKAETPAKPKKDQPVIPQTLGDVPPADENMIEPDRFRHLEGLEGDDLEAALAKMSPSEVDAWLDSAG